MKIAVVEQQLSSPKMCTHDDLLYKLTSALVYGIGLQIHGYRNL